MEENPFPDFEIDDSDFLNGIEGKIKSLFQSDQRFKLLIDFSSKLMKRMYI